MRKIFAVAIAILAAAITSRAQETPRAEVSAGYSYFRAGFSGGINQHGGSVSLAGNVNRWFGVVGDFGAYHASPYGGNFNTYTFLVGPRFSARNRSRVTPFAQVLLGGAHLTSSGGGSETPFAMSAGGGLDFRLTHRLALRQETDYLALRSNGDTLHSARASLGIVFRFGSQ